MFGLVHVLVQVLHGILIFEQLQLDGRSSTWTCDFPLLPQLVNRRNSLLVFNRQESLGSRCNGCERVSRLKVAVDVVVEVALIHLLRCARRLHHLLSRLPFSRLSLHREHSRSTEEGLDFGLVCSDARLLFREGGRTKVFGLTNIRWASRLASH